MRTSLRTSIAGGITLLALAALTACGPTGGGIAAPPGNNSPAPAVSSTSPATSEDTAAPTDSASSTAPSAEDPASSQSQAQPAPSTSTSAAAGPTTSTAPSSSPSASPTRAAALMKRGSTGEKVRELQVRLRSIGWMTGDITDTYGDATTTAVRGFQGKRSLPTSGEVDAATWSALTGMTAQPTHDEKYNVLRPGPAILAKGASGSKVKELQARLKQVGWFSGAVTDHYGDATAAAVKGFQGKRGIPQTGEVDQRTWDKLTGMTRQPTKAELDNETPKKATGGTAHLDPRCMTGRVMCISKTHRQLSWVVDGKVQLTMDARFGSEANITREGTFTVFRKVRDDYSRQYHSKMPYAMYFSGGEAVHYSSDFAARGYAGASHGCVNIRNREGLAWLYDQVRLGDKVVVHW